MQRKYVLLSRNDIEGIEQLLENVAQAASATPNELKVIHSRIGEILFSNLARLNLDDSLVQALTLANRIAAELLSPTTSQLHYPEGIWSKGATGAPPPFALKAESMANGSHELTFEKQRIAMTHVLAQIVQLDSTLISGGRALLEYERVHNLLSPDDLDIDV
jgi:hypothetical protein